MFYFDTVLKNLDLTGMDTRNVLSMDSMFDSCRSLGKLDLSSFDMSGVKSRYNMFNDCRKLRTVTVSGKWDEDISHAGTTFEKKNNRNRLVHRESRNR